MVAQVTSLAALFDKLRLDQGLPKRLPRIPREIAHNQNSRRIPVFTLKELKMAIRTIQIATDSFDGKDLPEWETVTLSLNKDAWELHLSEENFNKLVETLQPFVQNEPKKAVSAVHGAQPQSRPGGRRASKTNAQNRAAIATFVEEHGLGHVGPRGRIRQDFVDAWVEAGSPGSVS